MEVPVTVQRKPPQGCGLVRMLLTYDSSPRNSRNPQYSLGMNDTRTLLGLHQDFTTTFLCISQGKSLETSYSNLSKMLITSE